MEPQSKRCVKCRRRRKIDDFHKKGEGKRHSVCRFCKSNYNIDYYSENKERHAAGRKDSKRLRKQERLGCVKQAKDKPCADCGERYPHFVMDFDHRDPSTKVFTIGAQKSRSMSLDKLLEEIAKCDVVCANCHRYRTHQPVAQPG